MFPNSTWGKHYAVSAFIDRPGLASVVRIMAQDANTHLQFDPPTVQAAGPPLGAGQFLEFSTTENFVVSADQPILVAQFMYGEGTDSSAGDPAMVYEVPVEQYREDYTFLAPDTFTYSFVNIVSESGAPPMLDGATVTATPVAIGNSGLSVWATAITPGVHQVTTASTENFCGIKVYGTAQFTAYAYPGGLDLQVIVPQ